MKQRQECNTVHCIDEGYIIRATKVKQERTEQLREDCGIKEIVVVWLKKKS